MKLTNILILIFLLSAFAIGVSLQQTDNLIMQKSLDNVSAVMQNITFESSGNQYTDGLYLILEKFVNLAGVAFVEITRMGIFFGMDNPDYFEPDFILQIIKLLVILVVISLLIKPVSYLVVLIVLVSMWFVEKVKKRKIKNE